MADIPPVKVTARLLDPSTYVKYIAYVAITVGGILLLMGGYSVWKFFFPSKQNVSKPHFDVQQGGTVNYTNVQNEEKDWEVGVGAGGMNYDDKAGYFLGGWVKRKF